MKILIIEDERPIQKALSKKLTDAQFEVITSADGKEGLETALKEHPNLILLDIILPVMNGLDMLAKLRLDGWGAHVPVIVLTNLGDGERIEESKKYGVFDYLIKTDWKLSDVVSKVTEILKTMKKVLVIEDDKFLANAYRVKLAKSSYEVKISRDGNEGLADLNTFAPDLVILDLMMPVKDGFSVLLEMKKSERFKNIPVIVSSNLGQKEDIDKAKALGASDYVIKSDLSMAELLEKVNRLIK